MIEKNLTEKEFILILEGIDMWEHKITGPSSLVIDPNEQDIQDQKKFKDIIEDHVKKEMEKLKAKKYPALVLRNKIFKIQDKIWTINILSTKPISTELSEFEILDEALDLLDIPIPNLDDMADENHPLFGQAAEIIGKLNKNDLFEMYKIYREKKQKEIIDKKKLITELRIKLIELKTEVETEENKAILLEIDKIMKS